MFLFVIYTLFALAFNFVDMIATNYIFALNYWYTLYALYVFGKLMDNKKITTLKYVSFLSIVVYTAVYLYTIRYHENPWPERKFPLYDPFAFNNTIESNSTMEGVEEETNANTNVELP